MPFRVPPQVWQRLFSTSVRARTSLPSDFAAYDAATQRLTATAQSVPKLGRIAKWYLPTMAAIAIGMIYLPMNLYTPESTPSRRTVTLDAANRHIGFGIANALHEHNRKANKAAVLSQEERNQLLLEAYGERSSLEDMERAIAGMEANARAVGKAERNRMLEEAYGERTSLRDVQRAMQVYEVQ